MSDQDLSVEERLRACETLSSALQYFARWANEPLVHHVAGCRPDDVVKIAPGFCRVLREHLASIKAALPASGLNQSSPSTWRTR